MWSPRHFFSNPELNSPGALVAELLQFTSCREKIVGIERWFMLQRSISQRHEAPEIFSEKKTIKIEISQSFYNLSLSIFILSHMRPLSHIYVTIGGGNSPMKRAQTWSAQPIKDSLRTFFAFLAQKKAVRSGLKSQYFHIIGDKLINPIVGVYIPII